MLTLSFHFGSKPEPMKDVSLDAPPSGEGDFLVYVHRDKEGNVFYVGEGVGKRPWATDRHPLWHHYVRTRSEGKWTAQIVSKHGSKESAEDAEGKLIAHYAGRLVNWFGRDSDWRVQLQWLANRDAARAIGAEAKALSLTNAPASVLQFEKAMAAMYHNSELETEKGLIGELMRETCHYKSDPYILEWYTVVLMKNKMYSECVTVISGYFERFPPHSEAELSKMRRRAAKAELMLSRMHRSQ